MADDRENSGKNSTVLLLARILAIFFSLGALGALCGTQSVRLLYGGDYAAGVREGFILLIVSSCLGLPGVYLLRKRKGLGAGSGTGISGKHS